MAFNFGSAAGGAATTFLSTGNPYLAIGGGLLSGFMNKKSPDVNSILPKIDPMERARTSTASLGNWGQKSANMQTSAFGLGRKTTSDLIASGMDPVTAARMGASKQTEALLGGQDNLLSSAMDMEKNAFDRYSQQAFERDNDRASYQSWQSQQSRGFQQFAPAMMEGLMGLGDKDSWAQNGGLGKLGGMFKGLFNRGAQTGTSVI